LMLAIPFHMNPNCTPPHAHTIQVSFLFQNNLQ
jgi:hypothetical protein